MNDTNKRKEVDPHETRTTSLFNNSDVTSPCFFHLCGISEQVFLYGIGIIAAIAMVTNSIQLSTFSRRTPHKSPFRLYLISLSIVDSLTIFFYLPRDWLRLLLRNIGWPDVTPYDGNIHTCLTVTYTAHTLQCISVWLTVAMVTERLLATLRPLNRQSSCRQPSTATQTVAIVTIISLVTNSHVLFTWNVTSVTSRKVANESLIYWNCFINNDESICSGPSIGENLTTFTIAVVSVALINVGPAMMTAMAGAAIKKLYSNWTLGTRRLSSSTVARLVREQQLSKAAVRQAVAFTLFTLPFAIVAVITLCERLVGDITLRHADVITNRRLTLHCLRNLAEVLYSMNYAFKLTLCANLASSL